MTKPERIQLSRAGGFSLQNVSYALNGLEAVNVARPSKWGNPFNFRSSEFSFVALSLGCRADFKGRQEASVKAFRAWLVPGGGRRVKETEFGVVLEGRGKRVPIGARAKAGLAPAIDDVRNALRGKNLACWCKPGWYCHADVLLEIANA